VTGNQLPRPRRRRICSRLVELALDWT